MVIRCIIVQAKLAKLRREILEPSKSAGAGKGEGFDVTKVLQSEGRRRPLQAKSDGTSRSVSCWYRDFCFSRRLATRAWGW